MLLLLLLLACLGKNFVFSPDVDGEPPGLQRTKAEKHGWSGRAGRVRVRNLQRVEAHGDVTVDALRRRVAGSVQTRRDR